MYCGAEAAHRLPIFAVEARVLTSVACRGGAGCWVESIGVVFIVADTWGHGPASCLGPGGHCSLGWAGGPGRVASRSSSRAHSSQIESQVLWSGLFEGCLHHVLVVMLLELGPGFSLILKDKWKISIQLRKSYTFIQFLVSQYIMFRHAFKVITRLWLGLHYGRLVLCPSCCSSVII